MGEAGPFFHGVDDVRLPACEATLDIVVENLGIFRELRAVGDIQRGQAGGLEFFIGAMAHFLEVLLCKVHEDEAFVGLHDPVLEACGNMELLGLNREDQISKNWVRDPDLIKFHQGSEAGRNDGT